MLDFIINHSPIYYLVQSLWRDEAFSVLIAERPIASFLGSLNFEPPIYYVLLHIWVRIFGTSEISVRSLSFVGFVLATIVVIFWAEQLFKKHWLSWMTPVLFFFNPMLLYYAFEVRAYGWFMFFSTLSLFAYTSKKYKLLFIANVLAFYTHSYAIFIPFVQLAHYLMINVKTKHFFTFKQLYTSPIIRMLIGYSLVIAPWTFVIAQEALKGRPTWYYPVDLQLVFAVLGNMFVGYDGTPGGMWKYTSILSVLLLILFLIGIRQKQYRFNTSYLLLAVLLPLCIVIGVSFHKPLFVNRYLIYVTIAQVILIAYSIYQMNSKIIQKGILVGLIMLYLFVNTQFPLKKAKLDIRSTLQIANSLRGPKDLLYVSSPLIFFEAIYYTKDRQHVYLYNPENNTFPWYIGESAFDVKQMTNVYPEYPSRAVIVGEDNSITIAYRTTQNPIPITETIQSSPSDSTQ